MISKNILYFVRLGLFFHELSCIPGLPAQIFLQFSHHSSGEF